MTGSVRFGGRSAIIGDDIQTAHAELNDHAGDLGQRRSPGVGPVTQKQRKLTGATTTHPGGWVVMALTVNGRRSVLSPLLVSDAGHRRGFDKLLGVSGAQEATLDVVLGGVTPPTYEFSVVLVQAGEVGLREGHRRPEQHAEGGCVADPAERRDRYIHLRATPHERNRLVSAWRTDVLLLKMSVSVWKRNPGTLRSPRNFVPAGTASFAVVGTGVPGADCWSGAPVAPRLCTRKPSYSWSRDWMALM